jgi:gallidermin/nisin family lantibiotic
MPLPGLARVACVEIARYAPGDGNHKEEAMSAPIREVAPAVAEDLFDLDLQVGFEATMANPAVTSWSYCTPGCTSEGGGSGCSHCCWRDSGCRDVSRTPR